MRVLYKCDIVLIRCNCRSFFKNAIIYLFILIDQFSFLYKSKVSYIFYKILYFLCYMLKYFMKYFANY